MHADSLGTNNGQVRQTRVRQTPVDSGGDLKKEIALTLSKNKQALSLLPRSQRQTKQKKCKIFKADSKMTISPDQD